MPVNFFYTVRLLAVQSDYYVSFFPCIQGVQSWKKYIQCTTFAFMACLKCIQLQFVCFNTLNKQMSTDFTTPVWHFKEFVTMLSTYFINNLFLSHCWHGNSTVVIFWCTWVCLINRGQSQFILCGTRATNIKETRLFNV